MSETYEKLAKYTTTAQFVKVVKSMKTDEKLAAEVAMAYLVSIYNYRAVTHGNHLRMKTAGIATAMGLLGVSAEDITALKDRVFPTKNTKKPAEKKEVKLG